MVSVFIGAYLLLANLFAFGAFAKDKDAAENGHWRIPESTLLLIALAGGSLGALLGQRVLRHKTRKQPFRSILIAIAVLHIGLGLALIVNTFQVGS